MTNKQNVFQELLLRYSQEQEADDRALVEARMWDGFGETIAVLVVDMSGFTRLTRLHGIVHYLSMVRRMQLTAQPIIESYSGRVVRFEADNAFACFSEPGYAVRAAVALNLAMEAANLLTPDELDIYLSCGIDYGQCLIPDEHDFFGVPVNTASKLGEDLGEPGQILVTAEAMALVKDAKPFNTELVSLEIGGEQRDVHSILYASKSNL